MYWLKSPIEFWRAPFMFSTTVENPETYYLKTTNCIALLPPEEWNEKPDFHKYPPPIKGIESERGSSKGNTTYILYLPLKFDLFQKNQYKSLWKPWKQSYIPKTRGRMFLAKRQAVVLAFVEISSTAIFSISKTCYEWCLTQSLRCWYLLKIWVELVVAGINSDIHTNTNITISNDGRVKTLIYTFYN